MKKNIFISLLVGIIVATIFSGCKPYYTQYVYKPNDELYEYCAFDSLSYWIYEDSATQQIDSVVATKKLEKEIGENMMSGCYPAAKVLTYLQYYNIININDNSIRSERIEPTVYYPDPESSDSDLKQNELYVLMPCGAIWEYKHNLNCYYANVSSPSEVLFKYNSIYYKYSMHYDNITIGSRSYQDVKKMEFYFYSYLNNDKQITDTIISYWSRHIGLVRHEIRSDSTRRVWNLKDYNVVNVPNQYK